MPADDNNGHLRISSRHKNSQHRRCRILREAHDDMLRQACGYAMANAGHDSRLIQDWLGHLAIQHTARYIELSPTRFRDVWR